MAFRSGTVAVVGRPNVGKSSLMNHIVGEKVAITSSKPQTTRKSTLGVANRPGAQIVFIDTPGIHEPKTKLAKAMVDQSVQIVDESDCVLLVVDVSQLPTMEDERIVQILKARGLGRVVVALNKMDHLRPERVVAHYEAFESLTSDAVMMYTNALTGENVDKLVDLLIAKLPEGEALYPDAEFYTNQTIRDMAAELIREKALHHTREEVPHGIAVAIESWEDADPAAAKPLTRIEATIFVERKSQRPILIGHGGRMLKEIGQEARKDIEKLLGNHVYLGLYVKVKENWRDRPQDWRDVGHW